MRVALDHARPGAVIDAVVAEALGPDLLADPVVVGVGMP